MIRILFVAANPADTDSLRLGEEFREIQDKMRGADSQKKFQMRSAWAARPDDLLQQMNEFRPHILHFSGHGSSAGEIVLQDSSGNARPLSSAELRRLFGNFRSWLRIVVLNACYSNVQAGALLDSADIVIGMNAAIGDSAAISFAASFYRGLGFDRSVQDAFEQGLISIQFNDAGEEDTPALLHRPGIDPGRLTITDPTNSVETGHLIDDPLTPENIRQLLLGGSELILIGRGPDDGPTENGNQLLIELAMRQSPAVFVIKVHRRLTIGRAARQIVEYLLPDLDVDEYDWSLMKGGQELAMEHTFMMAGIRAGDRVLLVGNHRMPSWAPDIG
jgi:hypothetical protein